MRRKASAELFMMGSMPWRGLRYLSRGSRLYRRVRTGSPFVTV
jgi:hypothetical protein